MLILANGSGGRLRAGASFQKKLRHRWVLPRRSANLRHDWRRGQRDEAEFKTSLVVRPGPAVVAIRRHEDSGGVDETAQAVRPVFRPSPSCDRTLRRASAISFPVNRPCSDSHRATAARPARLARASLAALVIQAETLTPSRAAAARTLSWTSGSTVIASFGDGFPRGMKTILPQ